jgi:hypothetical protein
MSFFLKLLVEVACNYDAFAWLIQINFALVKSLQRIQQAVREIKTFLKEQG